MEPAVGFVLGRRGSPLDRLPSVKRVIFTHLSGLYTFTDSGPKHGSR